MDWFRWWHGTVTDPKFQWVARKSGQTVASVLAVWAVVLETGSTATQGNADATRGNVASLQCEDWDVALGLDDGAVQSIYDAMVTKGLICDGRIVAWDARQPKREDGGDPNTGALSSTERSRLRRERLKRSATHATETQRDATHATEMQRLDKSREEESNKPTEANASVDSAGEPPSVDLLGDDVETVTAQSGEPDVQLQCPVERIVKAYHELMPNNPRMKVLNDARRRTIAARWREAARLSCKPFGYTTVAAGLEAWRAFFRVCAESNFLTGKVPGRDGKPPFLADLEFLTSPKGFAKCLENKYHRESA
ncbi:hypothetical protein [Paraburkholderia caballeronis]|uniref:hypothetical protein n=1 Tax=Paraburkholderia caballeronis TaxID=416943 RepID=UPI001066707B|nr:hypothetical protein [Paraburkholderia caballeronis]TDV04662.1 hypothetical protein C7408_13124 [Paraburkholderia caballeronis]TDV07905.1 hypothetical protein C7406_13324 [Paraburkholderia caballeronis]TDV18196.1 hypothetical protein C7404_13124 [Paraburkholderia caballeronis]